MTIKRFFIPPPKTTYFLLGPRGTGKSKLISALYLGGFFLDLLLPETAHTYLSNPEYFKKIVEAQAENIPIVIDEIQKVPALLDVIHHLIEEKSPHQFILTGSSSRKLKNTGVNLLGGRALRCTLHPFMASELGDRFSLDNYNSVTFAKSGSGKSYSTKL